MEFKMYYYQIQFKQKDRLDCYTKFETLRGCKQEYFRRIQQANRVKKQDVQEIVVCKGNKIYGYYNSDFIRDKSKPVFVHNIFYGLD